MPHEEPDDCTDEEQDLIDGAVQGFRDWSDISGDIEFSRSSVRDAQRSITTILEELAEKGLALYSATVNDYRLTGGPSPFLGTVVIFRIARVDRTTPLSSR
ncbi:hypothetical protein QD712_13460 [Streptomyces acidiscabies]|uniref:hypothetical protein n=1 Tax=Streptomyces acidiscabies TaxID=42234 RepID=UPI0030D5FB5D